MTLPFIVDRRNDLQGRAMTHALLIGVSRYDHLSSLGAGAHTALRIYQCLNNADACGRLTAPLATVTLLLSPNETEEAIVAELIDENDWAPATGVNIIAAQARLHDIACDTEQHLTCPDGDAGAGMVFYYFGGHGADFFRHDPIGLASDANSTKQPWSGAFDHQEFRERLTRIEDALPIDSSRRARCLFLYDCCRTRDHGADFIQSITPFYAPILAEPRGVRPSQVLSATTEGFAAWEPTRPIDLPPQYDLPLSFFGHALLNVIEWSQDYSSDPRFSWKTSVRGMVDDIARAMNELAKQGGGEKLPGVPEIMSSPGDFAVLRSATPPQVKVTLRCDPEAGHRTTEVRIHERVGINFMMRMHQPAPWTRHPQSCNFVPGMFKITATNGGRTIEKTLSLKPVLTAWHWIFRSDAITVHDPAD